MGVFGIIDFAVRNSRQHAVATLEYNKYHSGRYWKLYDI